MRHFVLRSKLAIGGFIALSANLLPAVASACPICNTPTGQQVRAGIFGNDFWTTLLIVVSPFPILLLAIAAYHFDWPPFGGRSGSKMRTNPETDDQSI